MNQSKAGRRRFLQCLGITLGACSLTCAGLALLMTGEEKQDHPMPVGFPETTLGDATTGKRILVAYASAAGSTGGIAETIGRVLAESGAAVDLRQVGSVTSLAHYQAVVVGSAIHGGKWLPEAVDFMQANQDALRKVPTAFFLVGMLVASNTETNRDYVEQFLSAERALVKPVAEGRFVGALFLDKYPPLTGFGMHFFLAYCGVGLRGGDYRNASAVRAWAARTYALLIQ